MLILTDRLQEGRRLQAALGRLRPCSVVALHQAAAQPPGHAMVVTDVAFDNLASLDLLRAALARHRPDPSVPLLCLTRDPSYLALAQAKALGATAILPFETPEPQLLATARGLLEAPGTASEGRRRQAVVAVSGARTGSAALSHMFEAAQRSGPISPAAVERGGAAVLDAIGQASIRAWLDVVWQFDDATYQHCLLVAGLSADFALKLGLALPSQRLVSQAALVHDIGKARIPQSILNKPGKLSPGEMAVMRTHAAIGYQALSAQPGLDPRLLDVVRHHHEYLDGSGYPDGLKGDQIANFVRIVTVCDIYAALIERRPYKPPMAPAAALAILDEMGGKLDPGLVKAFHGVALAG